MSYSTSAPPALIVPAPMGSSVPQIWGYTSADAIATVYGAGYFTNGSALGMRVGDLVFVFDSNVPTFSTTWVKTVTAGGAASLSASVTTLASS